jgi:hypothetical protein
MKISVICAIFFVLAMEIPAQNALGTIREFSGLVELKKSASEDWVPARLGDTLERDMIISTGFRSFAVLALGDSVFTVRSLSRLRIEELSRSSQKDEMRLDLRAGRIRARVKAPPAGNVNVTVRSPSATASVRGTVFDFDTINLAVHEGQVDFVPRGGVSVPVRAGSSSYIDEKNQAAAPPRTETAAALTPDLPTGIAPGFVSPAGTETAAAAPSPSPGEDTPGGDAPGGDEGINVGITWW